MCVSVYVRLSLESNTMKKQYIGIFVVMMGLCNACSVEQEFIIVPKAKKKYISEQQDLELDGDIIISGTNFTGTLANFTGAVADLSKTVFLITKSSLNRVNARIDGQKSGLSKLERTERYAIKMKIMHELDRFHELDRLIAEIEKIEQRLDGFMVSLDQQFQSE